MTAPLTDATIREALEAGVAALAVSMKEADLPAAEAAIGVIDRLHRFLSRTPIDLAERITWDEITWTLLTRGEAEVDDISIRIDGPVYASGLTWGYVWWIHDQGDRVLERSEGVTYRDPTAAARGAVKAARRRGRTRPESEAPNA